jgi:hypothetical protein
MEDKPKEPTWPAIRDLFSQIITSASDWNDAKIIASSDEMMQHFHEAFPDVSLWESDMRLALHDLGIPFERNEHNNKYYYLARWR